ncbi:MAG TPA: glycoside hydrolase family 3 C-terminal domain-containing protein [Polyangiaceae bacterium]
MDPLSASSPDKATLPAYLDPSLAAELRIDALISELTREEKIACLGVDPSVPRLGIRASGHVEGLHGLALGGPGLWGKNDPIATTTYPQAVGLACTWDEECLREAASVEAYEARYYFQSPRFGRGGLVVRAPNADLARDPRWGRTEESYGEDAYLTGRLATAFVQGLQGDDPKCWKTAALLKHFLANSNENTRETSSSDFDERLFHEYYAVPFRMAIQKGGARAFMTAYNKHNGVPCTVHPCLEEQAVAAWGQDGIICTDDRAYRLLVTAHKHFQSLELAAAATIDAGISQYLDEYADGIKGALDRKLISEADIDAALRKNFRVMLRLGLLDPPESVPYAQIGSEEEEPWQRAEHQESVRRVTQKSIVLLKNEGNLLPLKGSALRKVAVIGPLADRVLTDWYSGTLPYAVSPVDGLRERLGSDRVRLASTNDVSAAIRAARESDVAILCVGNHPTGDHAWGKVSKASYGKEAVDRQAIQLEDEDLIRHVVAANPNTVVVLISSFPYAIEWTAQHVPAILHMSHCSQELGRALADVLVGDYNPGGRLVHTWPKSLADLPSLHDYDLRKGRTYQYAKLPPLFAFGFGLSYTRFAYSRLLTSALRMGPDAALQVSCDVTNIGRVFGDEVVQLYARYVTSRVQRPRQALVGFKRIELEPGETQTVRLNLDPEQLMYWDTATSSFVLEPGHVELRFGRSSEQVELFSSIEIIARPPGPIGSMQPTLAPAANPSRAPKSGQ